MYIYTVIETKQLRLKTTLFFQEKKKSWIRTRDVLHARQMLYHLSHRGSSAGQAESLNVMRGPDKHMYLCIIPGLQYKGLYTYMYICTQCLRLCL